MQKEKIKNICSYKLMSKIKKHAGESLYRLNAKTADCYAFSIDEDGKDWSGGWDWSSDLIDKDADYILMLESGTIYRVIK